MGKHERNERGQQPLPFSQAEATHAERKNLLGLALMRLEADTQLSSLMVWVFNMTKGGTEGELSKSYHELAAKPWGLCCSESKARSTVAVAAATGILAVRNQRYATGSQRANGYTIDWAGVREVVFPSLGRATDHAATGVSTEHLYKEDPLCISLLDDDVDDDKSVSLSSKKEVEGIWRLAGEAYRALFDPRDRLSAEDRRELVRVAWIVSGLYDRGEWLVEAARTARARGACPSKRISFWKTLLANRTGDAPGFWHRLDACDMPPRLEERLVRKESQP